MIISFFKFIIFNTIFLLTIVTLLLLFTRLVVLNETFYIYSFGRNNVYSNLSRGIKSASKEFLIGQFSSSNDYANLTLGQRQEIEKQVDSFISFIDEDTVRSFVSVNIRNILQYLKNQSGQLYLYLPINDWSLPDASFQQIPDYLKTTDINVREILKNTRHDTPDNLMFLERLKSTSKNVNLVFLAGVILQIFFILFYLLMSRKGERYQSIGKMFSFLGVIILILSWIFFTAQNIFAEGLAFKTGWTEVLTGTLVPIFAKPLVFTFTVYGLFILFIGIILYNKENKTRSL